MSERPPAALGQRLLIEDLALPLRIGVGEAERSVPQRILITLAIEVEPVLPTADDVAEVVDYGRIAAAVRALAGGERRLLERLSAEIAEAAFAADSRVLGIEVTLRKPDLFADVGSVGVTTRFRRQT